MQKCPYCGTENRDEESFCEHCGGFLDASTTTTTQGESVQASNSQSLTPGSHLQDGRYVIKKILGQGGMGSLALASDTRLADKRVVIKELISDHADPTEDVRNFKHEVQTLAHLDHPLIPGVTDHFQEGSCYFMVQEYVEGENLEARLERVERPMEEQDALRYAAEVLDILDYLEQQTPPIVHRDIKPANIIIGAKDQRAHLVDFGIARAYAPSNAPRKQTTALGTPGYAPPEQYQGNAEPRSDLYALAATLYHLVTNRDPTDYPPFQFPPVRTLNPLLSLDIEGVLTRALMLDVNQRYQTALEMKRDLDDILFRYFDMPGSFSTGSISGYTPPPPSSIRRIPASGPMSAYQSGHMQRQQFYEPPLSQPANHSPITPYQPIDMYDRSRQQSPLNQHPLSSVGFVFLLFVLFIFLLGLMAYFVLGYIHGLGVAPAGALSAALVSLVKGIYSGL
jgi:eukaryotic-like serine/threonine-protein kinase